MKRQVVRIIICLGMAEYEDVVYKTNIPDAYMVPCTQLLENPSPLLEDARFKQLLDKLAEEYRFCNYRCTAALAVLQIAH